MSVTMSCRSFSIAMRVLHNFSYCSSVTGSILILAFRLDKVWASIVPWESHSHIISITKWRISACIAQHTVRSERCSDIKWHSVRHRIVDG